MGGEAFSKDSDGSIATFAHWQIEELAALGLRELRFLRVPAAEREDLLQEAFKALLQNEPRNPPAYFKVVLRRLAARWRRDRARVLASHRSLEAVSERADPRAVEPWRRIALTRALRELDNGERQQLETVTQGLRPSRSDEPRSARSGSERVRLFRLRQRLKALM